MACNCRKNKTKPFGPSSVKAKEKAKEEPKKFVLRTFKGTQVFGSRLEAEAALRRSGGGQITTSL